MIAIEGILKEGKKKIEKENTCKIDSQRRSRQLLLPMQYKMSLTKERNVLRIPNNSCSYFDKCKINKKVVYDCNGKDCTLKAKYKHPSKELRYCSANCYKSLTLK